LATDTCEESDGSSIDASVIDGPVSPMSDARVIDASGSCVDFSSVHFDACNITPPSNGLVLDGGGIYSLDTDSGLLEDPDGDAIAHAFLRFNGHYLISVDSFTIASGNRLRVTGNDPLIIASWSTIDISGAIDASSSRLTDDGAGADPVGCGLLNSDGGDGEDDTSGGGGGGGGGAQGAGGDGGNGAIDQTNASPGSGGSARTPFGGTVRGGCDGGDGGNGGAGKLLGGPGGGAMQLTAAVSVSINGNLFASGGGGAGGVADAGGGGGGSGGFIGIQAPSITLTAIADLLANGGGGGGGGDDAGGQNGMPGEDAGEMAGQAQGGSGGGDGGVGGDGNSSAGVNGAVGQSEIDGGGGGGGAGGFVVLWSTSSPSIDGGAEIQPAAIVVTP
jgi:hypothetical protein